jgi:hypothetical protein
MISRPGPSSQRADIVFELFDPFAKSTSWRTASAVGLEARPGRVLLRPVLRSLHQADAISACAGFGRVQRCSTECEAENCDDEMREETLTNAGCTDRESRR